MMSLSYIVFVLKLSIYLLVFFAISHSNGLWKEDFGGSLISVAEYVHNALYEFDKFVLSVIFFSAHFSNVLHIHINIYTFCLTWDASGIISFLINLYKA